MINLANVKILLRSAMARSKELEKSIKELIMRHHHRGKGYKTISKLFEIPASTIQYVMKRATSRGTVQNLPRSGRPKKINHRLERKIQREVNINPRLTTTDIKNELQAHGVTASRFTVSRTLKMAGLKSCRPRKTPLLKARHIKKRLEFAKEHVDKGTEYWTRILWSDETKIELFGHNDVQKVWRRKNGPWFPRTLFQPSSTEEGQSFSGAASQQKVPAACSRSMAS